MALNIAQTQSNATDSSATPNIAGDSFNRSPVRQKGGLPPVEWRGETRASCGCTHGDPFHAGPRLGRGALADGRILTLPVAEDFDVFEHGCLRLLAGAEADLVDVLRLERGEEALHGRVIEAVAAAAHGLRDAVPLQHRAIRLGGVLYTAVAVVDQPARRVMPL